MTICLWCDKPATHFSVRGGLVACDTCIQNANPGLWVRGTEVPRKPTVLGNLNQRRKLSAWLAQIVGRLHQGQSIDKCAPWLGWDTSTGEFYFV